MEPIVAVATHKRPESTEKRRTHTRTPKKMIYSFTFLFIEVYMGESPQTP